MCRVPPFVETGRDHVAEGLWLHLFVLPQIIHVNFELHELAEGLDVRRQPGQAKQNVILDFKNFNHVHGDGGHLHAQALVAAE